MALELLYGEHSFQTAAKSNIDYLRIPPRAIATSVARCTFACFDTTLFHRGGWHAGKHLSLGLQTRPGIDDGSMTAARDKNGFCRTDPAAVIRWARRGHDAGQRLSRGSRSGALLFRQNRLSFEGNGNILTTSAQPVTSAKDEYLGVMATVGTPTSRACSLAFHGVPRTFHGHCDVPRTFHGHIATFHGPLERQSSTTFHDVPR